MRKMPSSGKVLTRQSKPMKEETADQKTVKTYWAQIDFQLRDPLLSVV